MGSMMAAHSQSLMWRSPQPDIALDFRKTAAALNRMRLDRSPFIPRTVVDYAQLRADTSEELTQDAEVRLENNEEYAEIATRRGVPQEVPFRGPQDFLWERNRVKSQETVFSHLYDEYGPRPYADWPSADEFKEEGDERHTSGYGRFLPIPRVPGNGTVAWKQKSMMEQFPLDKVHAVPRTSRIELVNDWEEITEPDFDIDGNAIDDPDESGKTAFVTREQHPRGQILEGPSGAMIRSSSGASRSGSMLGMQNGGLRRTRTASSLNPVAPEFASQFYSSGNARPRVSSTQVMQRAHIKPGAGVNPFSVLASAESSTTTSPTDGSPNQYQPPQDSHASRLDSMLPDFVLEDGASRSKRGTLQITERTEEEERRISTENVLKAWHLPTIDHINTHRLGKTETRAVAFFPVQPPNLDNNPVNVVVTRPASRQRSFTSPVPEQRVARHDPWSGPLQRGSSLRAISANNPWQSLAQNLQSPVPSSSNSPWNTQQPSNQFFSRSKRVMELNSRLPQQLQVPPTSTPGRQNIDSFTKSYFAPHPIPSLQSAPGSAVSSPLDGSPGGIRIVPSPGPSQFTSPTSRLPTGMEPSPPSAFPIGTGRPRPRGDSTGSQQDPIGTPPRHRSASITSTTPASISVNRRDIAERNRQRAGSIPHYKDFDDDLEYMANESRNVQSRQTSGQFPRVLEEEEESEQGESCHQNARSTAQSMPQDVKPSEAAAYGFGNLRL